MKSALALALLAAGAAPLMAQMNTATTTTASAAMRAPMGADYVKQAGASDLFERTSSQTVLKCAKTSGIRNFANMMLADHAKSTANVKAAAKSDNVMVGAPKLMPDQAQMITELKAAKGANCEKIYATQQVAAHEKALALHTAYSKSGDKQALKATAGTIVPVVEAHLNEVRTLAAR